MKTYNRLTFLRTAGFNKHGQRLAVFKCRCGTRKRMNMSQVTTGWIKSCGCLARDHAKALHSNINPATGNPFAVHFTHFETVVTTQMLRYYKDNARKRKLPFKLTRSEFEKLIHKDCHYCGTPPLRMRIARHSSKVHRGKSMLVNGIDRVNNSRGYVSSNAVPCCTNCNYAKHEMSMAQYVAHCQRVVDFARRK